MSALRLSIPIATYLLCSLLCCASNFAFPLFFLTSFPSLPLPFFSLLTSAGCVQEQIRFSINTECFVSIGISEMMREDEAIIIQGTQRIANYKVCASCITTARVMSADHNSI